MKPLAGKAVLFIGIGFYDYELAIADELARQGAEISIHEELPIIASKGFLTPLLRRMRIDLSRAIDKHQEKIVASAKAMPRIDYVFVVKGQHLKDWVLIELRSAHPQARFIAYHWDSMARYPDLLERQKFFDRVFTFDHADAEVYPQFRLRPLFFRREVAAIAERTAGPRKYDLSFVGWLHHRRLVQIRSLYVWARSQGLSVFFYLKTGLFSNIRLTLKGEGRFVQSQTMKFGRYVRVLESTRIVVDLPHPRQTGLTMRAIEALGAGLKLVTTAQDIARYDFFRPENVMIVVSDRFQIDSTFVSSPPVPVAPEIVAQYSLEAWVREVFEVDTCTTGRYLPEPNGTGSERVVTA